MEIFVKPTSKIFIVSNDGFIRYPDISEVEFITDIKKTKKITFSGIVSDKKISKCKCNPDEIILERDKFNVLFIYPAYKASEKLYPYIINLALTGNYSLEIGNCENLKHLYNLDKLVENYNKNFKKQKNP